MTCYKNDGCLDCLRRERTVADNTELVALNKQDLRLTIGAYGRLFESLPFSEEDCFTPEEQEAAKRVWALVRE